MNNYSMRGLNRTICGSQDAVLHTVMISAVLFLKGFGGWSSNMFLEGNANTFVTS